MRLLVLTKSTRVHAFGGMETHVDTLTESAAELGHEVIIITTAHPQGLPEEIREGIRRQYVGSAPPAVYSRAWWRESAAAARRWLRHGRVDLLLSFGLAGYGAAAAGIPIRHYALSYGDVLPHLISEWHDCSGLRGTLAYPKRVLAAGYFAWLERRLWSRVDGVIATYDALHEKLRRLGYRSVLSYNGIHVDRFSPDEALRQATRQALGIEPSGRVLLMLGTVNRQKGMWLGAECFLSLAARHPDLHLLIVGDGPDLPRLRGARGGRPASGRVRLVGARPPGDLPALYAASDFFLYPTLRMEGLPLAILEALAAGLPVIASDRGGIASAVKHEETGLLVRAGDVQALAGAVERLLSDSVLVRSLKKRGREWALAHADARPLTAALLAQLASEGPPAR